MAEIKQSIVTDSEQTKREMRAMVDEIQKLRDAQRQVHQESKEGHDEYIAGAQEAGQEVIANVAGLVTLEKTVEKVSEAYREFVEEIKNAGRARQEFETRATPKLVDMNLIGHGAQVMAEIGGSGLDRDQALATLTGLAQGDRTKQVAIDPKETAAAFNAAKLYLGDQQAQHDVAMLQSRLGTFLPGMSAEKRASAAVALRQMMPDNATELLNPATMLGARELASTGAFSPMQALGFEAAGINKQLGPRFAAELAEMLDKHVSTIAHAQTRRGVEAKPLTAEEIQQNEYAGADKAKRLNMLFAHPELAEKLGEARLPEMLRQVSLEQAQQMTKTLEEAARSNHIGAMLASPDMEVTQLRNKRDVKKQVLGREDEIEGNAITNVDEAIEIGLRNAHAGWMGRAGVTIDRWGQGMIEHALHPLESPAEHERNVAMNVGWTKDVRDSIRSAIIEGMKITEAEKRQAAREEKATEKLQKAAESLNNAAMRLGSAPQGALARAARDVNGRG